MTVDTSAAAIAAVMGDKPMSQGATLITRHTKNWSAEEIAASNALERCQIFTDFNIADEGRGRKLVARFATQEGAAQFMALRVLVPALSAQLTAETARADVADARVAAAYNAAAAKVDLYNEAWDDANINGSSLKIVAQSIRALATQPQTDVMQAMIDAAVNTVLDAASKYMHETYGSKWTFLNNPIDRDRIYKIAKIGGAS